MLCTRCCQPIDPATIGDGEYVAWCPHCRRIFRLPLFTIPGWMCGIVVLLVIKVQCGI